MKSDPVATFQRFARQANEESPVATEVASRVLATLRSRQASPMPLEREYYWFGVSSLIAACAASLMFWVLGGDDSLWMLAQPFITVLP